MTKSWKSPAEGVGKAGAPSAQPIEKVARMTGLEPATSGVTGRGKGSGIQPDFRLPPPASHTQKRPELEKLSGAGPPQRKGPEAPASAHGAKIVSKALTSAAYSTRRTFRNLLNDGGHVVGLEAYRG